ncbi:6-phosphofructokinase [[Clostridium] aminophilum]|nr:6-phosphofructokinase [[Clostridium] aminophilum]
MKNLLVAQSGGPTAAINATLAGIIEAAVWSDKVDRIFGADYGIQGVLEEKFIDLTKIGSNEKILDQLSTTPSAALGSCRYKLKDPKEDPSEFQKIIDIFHRFSIAYFVYIGGNDSMDTVWKLSAYMKAHGVDDITVVGAPKTIDNDLYGIDHCPGFGSAAKYIATSCAELEREIQVYDTPYVIIVEMMGRNAGWLTAAAALAEGRNGGVPYLIYLEERPFSIERMIGDIREKLETNQGIIVAVSEGIHDGNGKFISELGTQHQYLDAFGHSITSGAGKVLEEAVKEHIGCKVRSIELNLLQRCAGHLLSATDIEESRKLGSNAVKIALRGGSGRMSSLKREPGEEYSVIYTETPITEVANREKKVPQKWINEAGNGVKKEMIDYLLPLIQGEERCRYEDGVPKYVILKNYAKTGRMS